MMQIYLQWLNIFQEPLLLETWQLVEVKRKLPTKSTTDDYFWGWMMIKTIGVEETGRGIPGVSKIEYQTNHKFGLVAIKAYFEDGTTKVVSIYSTN